MRQRRDRRLRQRAEPDVGVETVEVSPDGKSLYGLSPSSDSITLFTRDTETGELTPVPAPDGCLVSKAAEDARSPPGWRSAGDRLRGGRGRLRRLGTARRDPRLRPRLHLREADPEAGDSGVRQQTGPRTPMQNGTAGECVNGVAMNGISSVAVLANGTEPLRDDEGSGGRRRLRTRRRREIAQLPVPPGARRDRPRSPNLPWTEGTCADGRALMRPTASSPAGTAATSTPRPASGGSPASTSSPPPRPSRRRPLPTPPPPSARRARAPGRRRRRSRSN